MLVAIDGLNLSLREGTGIARYGEGLLRAIKSLGLETGVVFGADYSSGDQLLAEVNFFNAFRRKPARRSALQRLWRGRPSLAAAEIPLQGSLFRQNYIPDDVDRVWNIPDIFSYAQHYFRRRGSFLEVDIPGVDVMHWTSVLPVRARGAVNIYTIHDMIPAILPGAVESGAGHYLDACRLIAASGDAIVTVSEKSRSDIARILNCDLTNIHNNYLDISMDVEGLSNIDARNDFSNIGPSFGLNLKEYYIYFGAWEPKKNISRIIEAYLTSSVSIPLVVCGASGWGDREGRSFLDSLKNRIGGKQIVQLDYLPRDILSALIAGAKATIFPSLYEGFGLPVLESMARGTAVISSTMGSLPEVAGDAAMLVDAFDVRALARAMEAIDQDHAIRVALEEKGVERAGYFSAENYRARLAASYRAAGVPL